MQPNAETAPTRDAAASKSSDARIAGRTVLTLVLGSLVIALLVFVGYRFFEDRLAARRDLAEALDLVKEADSTVIAVDEVVRSEIITSLAKKADEASAQVPPSVSDLEKALTLLFGARESLAQGDRQVADALRTAARARLEMLEQAPLILDTNARAARAIEPAKKGIESLLISENLAEQAVEKFNLQTKEGVTASSQLTAEALAAAKAAIASFEEAEKEFSEAEFETFIEYANGKKALLEQSEAIDAAWLAGDLAKANSLVEAYNAKDAEVSKLGEALPESETAPIAAAFDKLTTEAVEVYLEARKTAADADEQLRKLLGEEISSGE